MAHLFEHGYLYDDCYICGGGDRPGIHWVDYEHDYRTEGPYSRTRKRLVCSGCIGEGLAALAKLVKDEDGADDPGDDDSLSGTARGVSGANEGTPKVARNSKRNT